MKNLFFLLIFVSSTLALSAQSFSPASFNKKKTDPGSNYLEGTREVNVRFKDTTVVYDTTIVKSTNKAIGEDKFVITEKLLVLTRNKTVNKPLTGIWKKEWFLPFRNQENELQEKISANNSMVNGPNAVMLRPSFDSVKSQSVYVDMMSLFVGNNFRMAVGTNISQAQFQDSVSTPKEIAFQKLTNGGGDLVFNLYRPLLFFDDISKKAYKSFFVTSLELNGFIDIKGFNQDYYNPGFGCLTNASFDYRFFTKPLSKDSTKSDLFFMGFTGRYQYNFVNQKYKAENSIDGIFNNLSISSIGVYFGIAMFKFQFSYNYYSKSDLFFNDKKWLVRIDLIPVQF